MMPGQQLPPPMRGQMPIGQNPTAFGMGQKPMTPSMGGQVQPGMGGMAGQQMQGGISGGMAGQYQQGMQQSGRVDYAAQQRQMLNAHLQQQGRMAMQSQSSGGFFSRIFGGASSANQAQTQQRAMQQQGQGGRRGLLSTLGFGRSPAQAGQTQSYAARRADAYKAYKTQTMERNKMEKEIARRSRLAESSKSSTMQRFNTSKMQRLQKQFDKGSKAYKKSYIDYKYTK